jgi:serine/threonine protein kinase/Flp pilus assembly protein TadD
MKERNEDNTQTHIVLATGTKVTHYQIVKKIGAGGMGEVYLADDTKLKRKVALKFLPVHLSGDPDFKSRFVREAEATAKLNHPNIITIYEVSEYNGRPFFAMELVEGQSLRDLAKGKELSVDKIIELALQICEGLGAAHDNRVVHRDIKPSNIVIDAYGRPKILDFGLAAIEGGEQLTKTGSTMGTIRYMSPEQIRGEVVDQRSDLFSLGAVLYELITGRTPFERENEAATLRSITQDNYEPLGRYKSDIPDELQRIISKLLEKNSSHRYQQANGVISDLKRLGSASTEVTSKRPSIAVLPFSNMSTDEEQEYFCDGIAEDILNHLAKIESLRVVSRTSSFAFKNTKEDLRDVGRKLLAESILEGSVRKAGNRIRVTAQLIKVEDGYHLWSEQYNREMDDVFAIQDEISESIVQALRVKINPEEELIRKKAPTRSMEAYQLYLQGRAMSHLAADRIDSAVELFSEAIKLDPNYALAYAGLADALSINYQFSGNDENDLNNAIKASTKAIELDSDLAEAYSAYAVAVSQKKEYEEAENNFLKAIELNPSLFEAYYNFGRVCFVQGQYEKGGQLLEQASNVKLDDYQAPLLAASLYSKVGQKEKMEELALKGIEIARRRLVINPTDVRAIYLGAGAYERLGDYETAIEWANKAIELAPDDHSVYYNVACIYSRMKQVDEAIDHLKKAIDRRFSAKLWIETDPDLDPIRGHQEYEAVLNSIK